PLDSQRSEDCWNRMHNCWNRMHKGWSALGGSHHIVRRFESIGGRNRDRFLDLCKRRKGRAVTSHLGISPASSSVLVRRVVHSQTVATRHPMARRAAILRVSRAEFPSSFLDQNAEFEAGTVANGQP